MLRVLVAGLLLLALLAGWALWQYQAAADQLLQLNDERLLEVPPGSTPNGLLIPSGAGGRTG